MAPPPIAARVVVRRPRPRRGEGQGDGAGPALSLCRSGSILRGELGRRGPPARREPGSDSGRQGRLAGAGLELGGRAVAGFFGPTSLCSSRPPQVAMFSSIAPLARHNPFYAPHFQLVQDGVRKRPAEAPATRRGLAAASADEGESGTEGPGGDEARGRAGLAAPALPPALGPVPARAAQGMSALSGARPGWEGPALGLRARLEDEEGHGRGRRWQCFRSPGWCVLRSRRDPGLPGKDMARF